jgi:hypothetical protein
MTHTLLLAHGLLAAAVVIASVFAVQARSLERFRRYVSILLATLVAQTLAGDVLYPTYLRNAKPVLRAHSAGSRTAADVFDVKEHLAFLALVLTFGAFFGARGEGVKVGPFLRTLVGSAHGAIVLVAALGLVVASLKQP